MKKNLMVLSSVVLAAAPVAAFAQSASVNACGLGGNSGTLFGILCLVGKFLNAVIPVLIALGVVYFIWGVVSFVISDDEEAKAAGKNRMIFGIIGLAVIVGMWGLVTFLTNTFGVSNPGDVKFPAVVIPNP